MRNNFQEEESSKVGYIYYRNGVEYYTSNEAIAANRTDTGEYQIINHDNSENNSEESK